MGAIDRASNEDLHRSLLAELAKMSNEVRCALADNSKIAKRLEFSIMMINEMIDRDVNQDKEI